MSCSRQGALIALAASLLLAAREAAAQELVAPAPRQGYFFGGGLRSGALDVQTRNAGNLGFMNGGGLVLRAGEMADERFGFGLLFNFSGGANGNWSAGGGGLQMEGQVVVYPDLALRAGIGLGGLGVKRKDQNQAKSNDPTGSAGGLYTLGMSYDWYPWRDRDSVESGGLALTFFAEATVVPGDGVFGVGAYMGVELTFWTGLQRNKLRLPDAAAFARP